MKRLCLLALVPALALGIYDMKWFEPNAWRTPLYNDARWGIDVTVGNGAAGGSWPEPLHNCYVFGSGPWFGCVAGTDTLVTFGYNPNSGGTEFGPTLCRYWREGTGDSLDRVYMYPGDWPPPLSRFPMAPQDPLADAAAWACCGDSDPANHIAPGRPLGIDLAVTALGFTDSLARDFFYLRYDFTNTGGSPLESAYAGMVLDADIGDAGDDRFGLILDHVFGTPPDTFRLRNTGFVFDNNNYENAGQNWEDGVPGAVAVHLIEGPNGLGLTAFKSFAIDYDPVTDPAQYLTLAGYDYRTGEYLPYDSIDDGAPADKRILLCTGPFDLAPDSTATFVYAVVAAPFGDAGQPVPDRDTTPLALRCFQAEQVFPRLGVTELPPVPPLAPLRVMPSPARAGQVVRVTGPSGAEPVSVYDASGRLRLRAAGRLETAGLERGVYLLRTRGAAAKLIIE